MIFVGGNRIGGFNCGHLQVVNVNSGTELEVQRGQNWRFLNQSVDGASKGEPHTPRYREPDNYTQVQIDIGDRDPLSTWAILLAAHERYATDRNLSTPYLLVTQNSNTYINTLLSIIGVNLADYLGQLGLPTNYDPMPDHQVEFNYPGAGMNVIH